MDEPDFYEMNNYDVVIHDDGSEHVIQLAGPNNALGMHTKRCKRSAMFVVNGVIEAMAIAEAPDDPAGDDRPEVSCIENMLKLIGECDAKKK